ncbi:cation efflux family-domain-containing protein [Globomyces pollinis-pini]|nr:cation efflux family-domain-containing protein [Globomyces pollinis-pini]
MFGAKFYGALASGSASMWAESMHSLADVLNESLLMWGIWRSLKKPDIDHPYGYMTEKYAWALVSGVGVFFLGGGVTLYHGLSGLLAGGHILGDIQPALMALGGCLLFEMATLTVAYRHISKSAAVAGVTFYDYLKKGADPTSVQVFMEDSAALLGVMIAGTSLVMSKYLALPWLDSMGSITIGLLLSSVAVFLVRRNIAGLVQNRMERDREEEIIALLESDPVVKSVHDIKSTSIGPDWARFKAEILFDGKEIVRRYHLQNPHKLKQEISLLKSFETDKEITDWIVFQGGDVLTMLGKEVDRLEVEIQSIRPEVKHIDLEIL